MSSVSRKGPYDQFLLFGDSITEQSASQDRGFAFMPALQNGMIVPYFHLTEPFLHSMLLSEYVGGSYRP